MIRAVADPVRESNGPAPEAMQPRAGGVGRPPRILATLALLAGAANAAQAACPARVDAWPEQPELEAAQANPRIAEALSRAWQDGPNFACSAVLVTWGCGTGCVTGGIYDAHTETWRHLPFAVHRGLEQQTPLLEYVPESNLLIATGSLNECKRGVFRFQWKGQGLNRLHP